MSKQRSKKRKLEDSELEDSELEENEPLGELGGPASKAKKKWTHFPKKKAASAPPPNTSKKEVIRVPAPKGVVDMAPTAGLERSHEMRVEYAIKHDSYRLSHFRKGVDEVQLTETLEELKVKKAPKGGWKGVCKELSKPEHPSIAVSTVYLDSSGVPIFAYFANRQFDKSNIPPQRRFSLSDQYEGGRTSADVTQLKTDGVPMVFDGITVSKGTTPEQSCLTKS